MTETLTDICCFCFGLGIRQVAVEFLPSVEQTHFKAWQVNDCFGESTHTHAC